MNNKSHHDFVKEYAIYFMLSLRSTPLLCNHVFKQSKMMPKGDKDKKINTHRNGFKSCLRSNLQWYYNCHQEYYYVESFVIVSQSAQNGHVLFYAALDKWDSCSWYSP